MAELKQAAAGEDTQVSDAEEQEIRMILVGKTGAGKSRTGNTILGENVFKFTLCASTVTSQCEKETGEFEGQQLAVVDTPGLFDTRMSQEEVKMEISRSISFAAPGPHVFLVVIHPGRFTKEEQETVKILQEVFGREAAAYTMVVFTHGDDLEEEGVSIDESINGNPALRAFISQCGGGYIVFNNKIKEPDQVRELLEKINMMVLKNGGSYFINEQLEEAKIALALAIARLLKKHVDMKMAGTSNPFVQGGFTTTSIMIVGAGTGAAMGSLLGKVGSVVGGAVGAICAAAVAVKRERCRIQ